MPEHEHSWHRYICRWNNARGHICLVDYTGMQVTLVSPVGLLALLGWPSLCSGQGFLALSLCSPAGGNKPRMNY